MPESPLLTVQNAAEYVQRSVDFVRKELRYEIPYVQHREYGPIFFYKTDLDRWLAAHTTTPAVS
jgi:hypothetical protein